jgi:aminopeptidase N
MRDPAPQAVRLADYTQPAYFVSAVTLDVDIRPYEVAVRSTLAIRRNASAPRGPLVLDGEALELLALAIDGRSLAATEYTVDEARLTVPLAQDAFSLEMVVRFDPWKNTKLEGFFASRDGLFTQCEAEGFRRITYFPDRPDVMATYTVTLCADRGKFPNLLANGNLVASGDGEPRQWFAPSPLPGRHWAQWHDPFPKPCYLFAMVAANLDLLEGRFVTRSGKNALLQVYVEPGKLDQADFALHALKKSMKWDEEVFGLELDLDRFMIVAVGDFNMGAMENKGLNIFNTRFVLARPETATDTDYMLIDRVVAHEYFHNWTGNRVTCRDWFQLSLKEGLTVFRDQEYGADMYSRAVQRIQEVRSLRERQFPEDAGPMAHPVRPEAFVEINNFYTPTVYEKGAEVVRMCHTLIGPENFRKGMDLYFRRHDGQAVTCDDFLAAMQQASGTDLAQFGRWYAQAGTPVVDCEGTYDVEARTYTLRFRQSCPPTPGQAVKLPLHIPLALGLVGPDGTDLPLQLEAEASPAGRSRVVSLKAASGQLVFVNVAAVPVPSLFRGFSAPVTLRMRYGDEELGHLMARDSDAFNRWEAGQVLATRIILAAVAEILAGKPPVIPGSYIEAVRRILAGAGEDPAFAAEALALPSEPLLAEQMDVADPDAIHAARVHLMQSVARALQPELEEIHRAFAVTGAYSPEAGPAGRRALRNIALAYLATLDGPGQRALALAQFEGAGNMTDALAALACLADSAGEERAAALAAFHAKWKDEALVVDKWLRVQATSSVAGVLGHVRALMRHPAFDLRNPNKARSLLHAFAMENPIHFHAADGSGYRFVCEQVVALDRLNPQIASRLARAFDRWKRFDSGRMANARAALESLRDTPGLSRDAGEIVDRALA